MISREDILSIEFLKKTEYHGCCKGMRYRLEKQPETIMVEETNEKGETETKEKVINKLKTTIWPEPFNFHMTPEEEKTSEIFTFDEDGIVDAIAWMNDQLFAQKERFDRAKNNWQTYKLPTGHVEG